MMTETIECPVCIEVMTEVNTIRLECSHAVCIACEQRMMKTPTCVGLTDFDITIIKCPICRNVPKPTYDNALKSYNVKKRIISQLKTANTEHLNRMHAYRRENDILRRQLEMISDISSNVNQYRNARSQRAQHRSHPPVVAPPVVVTPVVEAPVVEAPVVEAPVVEAPVVEAPVVEAPVVEAPVVEAPVVEAPVVEEGEIVENAPVIYQSLFPSYFDTLQFCQGVNHYNHIDESRRRTRTRKHCVTCPFIAACNDCHNECHTCRQNRLDRRMTQLQYARYISLQTVA